MLWYYIRMTLIGGMFICMFFTDVNIIVDYKELLVESIFTIISLPISLIFVIGLQSRNPYFRNYKWNIPNWYSNFLDIRDPLQLFSFFVYLLLVGGLGTIVKGILVGVYINDGLFFISSSIGLFLGVKICIYLFRYKYED